MSRLSTHRSKSRPGAAVLEFALAAPIVFMFVLGLIEVGRGYMALHLLEDAARTGCRAGTLPGTANSQIEAAVLARLDALGMPSGDVTILVNGVEGEAATAVEGDRITVTVAVPVEQFTWVPGGQYLSGALKASYSLRRE